MSSFFGNLQLNNDVSCTQGKKNKKYFWVPAIAPITSVILATLFVYLFRADKQGVQIVSTQVSTIKAQLFLHNLNPHKHMAPTRSSHRSNFN